MSDEEVKKKLNKLIDFGDWSDECKKCGLPQIMHQGACARQTRTDSEKALNSTLS